MNEVKYIRAGRFVSPNGDDLGPASPTPKPAPAPADAPQLRTGDLPGNFVGIGKLKEGGVTTFEQLREKDKAALVALGLTDEQADSALAKANDPLGPARTVS